MDIYTADRERRKWKSISEIEELNTEGDDVALV